MPCSGRQQKEVTSENILKIREIVMPHFKINLSKSIKIIGISKELVGHIIREFFNIDQKYKRSMGNLALIKRKTQQSFGKVSASIIWDSHGINNIKLPRKCNTIYYQYYCELFDRRTASD